MATTKLEFQELADELINGEFADFRVACEFVKKGGFTPPDTIIPDTTDTVNCIIEDYNASQFNGVQIQVNDFKLLARPQEFTTLTPRTDNLKVTVQGQVCTVISSEQDPANAVWVIQVRG